MYFRHFALNLLGLFYLSVAPSYAIRGAMFTHRTVVDWRSPAQEQMNRQNTVYVINSRINLKGATLSVPKHCLLSFEGEGQICNGIIIGDSTRIQAPIGLIMDNVMVSRSGTWCNERSYPEWFGACSSQSYDSKMAIQKAIDVADTCVLSSTYYMAYDTQTNRGDALEVCAVAVENKVILGKRGSRLLVDAKWNNTEKTSVFWAGDNAAFDGVNIEFFNTDYSGWTGKQAGVYRIQGGNVKIENTTLRGAMAAWVNISGKTGRKGFLIRNNYVHDCDCGVIIQGGGHFDGEVYPIGLIMENNTIEKEHVRHSEFVSFWGSATNGGRVYYTDVQILNNYFSGGWQGGCITGDLTSNGLKDVVIMGNRFYDCGECSFYNAEGLIYVDNQVTGSTFLERQVKGEKGSYPHLLLVNCTNCLIDNNSCFGLHVKECKDLKIGRLKQTLCMDSDDPYMELHSVYVTNFMSPKIENSTLTIEELTLNPFRDDNKTTELCRYYIYYVKNSKVNVKRMVSNIPIQMSVKNFTIGVRVFRSQGNNKKLYIDTT